jgi:CelD/BcsL family acetyltransferase involved in cellulose biosynthesis
MSETSNNGPPNLGRQHDREEVEIVRGVVSKLHPYRAYFGTIPAFRATPPKSGGESFRFIPTFFANAPTRQGGSTASRLEGRTRVMKSSVYTINPLEDRRWKEFLDRHPNSSIFHTQGWLRSLKATYQYEPIAFTTAAPGTEIRNAIVFCTIRSWLTGNRMVSLPFSDYCEPLVDTQIDLNLLLLHVEEIRKRDHLKYVELRPVLLSPSDLSGFRESDRYLLHGLDLKPNLDDLLHSFHKDCVQRKIRKSQREGLEYEVGRSEAQLHKLYHLLKLTRRRHKIPPQPIEWFRNILSFVGDAARIHIVEKDGLPVAGILTLSHGKKVVYKYGGSDASMHHLGGMAHLFWKSIQEAKTLGADEFDFGRSGTNNAGLISFKEHWAAKRRPLYYWSSHTTFKAKDGLRKFEFPKKVFACLPYAMQAGVGRILYRHIG